VFFALELTAGESLFRFVSKAPGVSAAPGVPGVRSVAAADGATLFAPPAGPSRPAEPTWAHVGTDSKTASGNAAIDLLRPYMVLRAGSWTGLKFMVSGKDSRCEGSQQA